MLASSATSSGARREPARSGARRPGPGGPPAPFVVASPRSGTTLLRMMLDAHPEMAVPFETHFVPELIEAVDEPAAAPRGRSRCCAEHRRWGDFAPRPRRAPRRACARTSRSTRRATRVRSFFVLYAETQGKPRWGDKTPEYVEYMRPIERALPEARFVHVIRDGRDVALSRIRWRQKRSGRTPPVRRMARTWKEAITVAREQARRVGHYLEVRYEDLVAEHRADPAADLRVRRARVRPGDARLPRARRRAAAGDRPRPCPSTSDRVELDAVAAPGQARDGDQAAGARPDLRLAPRDERRGPRRVRGRGRRRCSPSSATRSGAGRGRRPPTVGGGGTDGREPAPAPFIVANPGSGTTLLRMMLDAHPELAIPPETHFVPE